MGLTVDVFKLRSFRSGMLDAVLLNSFVQKGVYLFFHGLLHRNYLKFNTSVLCSALVGRVVRNRHCRSVALILQSALVNSSSDKIIIDSLRTVLAQNLVILVFTFAVGVSRSSIVIWIGREYFNSFCSSTSSEAATRSYQNRKKCFQTKI